MQTPEQILNLPSSARCWALVGNLEADATIPTEAANSPLPPVLIAARVSVVYRGGFQSSRNQIYDLPCWAGLGWAEGFLCVEILSSYRAGPGACVSNMGRPRTVARTGLGFPVAYFKYALLPALLALFIAWLRRPGEVVGKQIRLRGRTGTFNAANVQYPSSGCGW